MLRAHKTWTRRRIGIIVGVAVVYGVWFNYLDSAAYCEVEGTYKNCISVGQTLGGNLYYQPWNIIGHCIPGLFLLLLSPKKAELFLAGVLISSAVMDSPLWGAMRLAHFLLCRSGTFKETMTLLLLGTFGNGPSIITIQSAVIKFGRITGWPLVYQLQH
jgi:hypothetical protein